MTSTATSPAIASLYLNRIYELRDLLGDPRFHYVISANDLRALVAVWSADEALIDSDVAYPDCPDGSDPVESCGECWAHQPIKAASGALFDLLATTLLGEEVARRLFERIRASHEDVVESLLAVGVRLEG